MKKLIAFVLAGAALFSLAACANSKPTPAPTATPDPTPTASIDSKIDENTPQRITGVVEEFTDTAIEIKSQDGKILIFDLENLKIPEELKIDSTVDIFYIGKITDEDTNNVKVTSIEVIK